MCHRAPPPVAGRCVFSGPNTGATPTPGPVDRVMAFQDAFNKPALDEAAALFLDDQVGVILQGLLLSSSLGVRDTLDYATATGLQLEFSDCVPDGEAVNCQLHVRDDSCLKSFGPDPVHDTARIKFQDGRIVLLTTEMATEEAKKWFDAQWQLDDWIRQVQADAAEKLNQLPSPGNTAKQQGEMLAQLCKDWAAAKK
jgi:hypothetical protein